MIWVTHAEYLGNRKFYLEFNDNIRGEITLKSSELLGPIFEPFKNENFLKKFKLNSWTLEWENGADLAPEYLYKLLQTKI